MKTEIIKTYQITPTYTAPMAYTDYAVEYYLQYKTTFKCLTLDQFCKKMRDGFEIKIGSITFKP